MLLKCVSSILEKTLNVLTITNEEEELLMSCESLEKLISDNYEAIAAQLVKKICPNNLYSSEKVAIVLLKGINKS